MYFISRRLSQVSIYSLFVFTLHILVTVWLSALSINSGAELCKWWPLTRWSGLISLGVRPMDIMYPDTISCRGHNVRHSVAFLPQTHNLNLIMRYQTDLNWGTRDKIPDQYSSTEQRSRPRRKDRQLSQIGDHEGDVTTKRYVGSSTAS